MDREYARRGGRDITALFETAPPLVVLSRSDGSATRSREERREHGRRLLAEAAALLVGAEPHAVSVAARCEHCGGDHGRPLVSVPGRDGLLPASVSHAGGTTVVAVSDRAVGVDVETLTGNIDRFAAIRAVAGPWAAGVDDGADALRAWTTVEAVLKADGRGLDVDPRRVRRAGHRGSHEALASIDDRETLYAVSSAVLDGLVLAVAVEVAAG